MIPFELKQLPQWVGFKLIPQEGKKDKKIPINPHTGQAADTTDPTTWGLYSEAISAVNRFNLDGAGFVFNGKDYFGIDLDKCVVDGKLNEFATKIEQACNSYTALSSSNTGIHIIGKGEIERAIKTEKIEVYNNGRFFALTGRPVYPVRPIASINGNLTALVPEFSRKHIPFVERVESITEGNRNNVFMSLAGSMRNKGMTAPEMYALLKPKAMQENFPLEELQGICERAGNYAIVNSGDSFDIETFLKDEQKVEWIVPGAIAKASIGFIAGLPESRKTWIMMDLAVQAAKGDGLWLGKFPVKKSKVLFIDQERAKPETQRRLKAVISTANTDMRLSLKTGLSVKSGSSIRLNLQDSFEAFKREVYQSRPDLIIIDSFAASHTADENNRQSIQQVLENVKQIRNEIGCTFIFISHENKFAFGNGEDKQEPSIAQMAGSVAIPAVAEFVFTVRKLDTVSSMIYNTKNTLAPSIEPFRIRVMDRENGVSVEAY